MQDLYENNRAGVVEKVLGYYDRLYDKHKHRHRSKDIATIDVSTLSKEQVVSRLQTVKDEKYPQTE